MNKGQIYVANNPALFIAENVYKDYTDNAIINPIGLYSVTGKDQLPYSMLGEYPDIPPNVYYFRRRPSSAPLFDVDHFAIAYNENENKFYWFYSGENFQDYSVKTQIFASGVNSQNKEDIYLPTGWNLFDQNVKKYDFFINDKFYQKNIFTEGSSDLSYKITGQIDIQYRAEWDEIQGFESSAGWRVEIEDEADSYTYYVKLDNDIIADYSPYVQRSESNVFYISESFFDQDLYGNLPNFNFNTEKTIEFKKGDYVAGQSYSNGDYQIPEELSPLSYSIPLSPSVTPSRTATPSITPSITKTPSVTPTITRTPTVTPTVTKSPTPTPSIGSSTTPTPTITKTPTPTPAAKTVASLRSLHIKDDVGETIKLIGLDKSGPETELTWKGIQEERDLYRNFVINFFEKFETNSLSLGKYFTTLSIKTKNIDDFPALVNTDAKGIVDQKFKIHFINDFFTMENHYPKRVSINIDTWDGDYVAFDEKNMFGDFDFGSLAAILRNAVDSDGSYSDIIEKNPSASFLITESLINTPTEVQRLDHDYPNVERVFVKTDEHGDLIGLEEVQLSSSESAYVVPMIIHERRMSEIGNDKLDTFLLNRLQPNGSFANVYDGTNFQFERFKLRTDSNGRDYYINEPDASYGDRDAQDIQVIVFDEDSFRWERVFLNPTFKGSDKVYFEGDRAEDFVAKPSVALPIASPSEYLSEGVLFSNYQAEGATHTLHSDPNFRDFYRFEIILVKKGSAEYESSNSMYFNDPNDSTPGGDSLSAEEQSKLSTFFDPQAGFDSSFDQAFNSMTSFYDNAASYNIFKNFLYHNAYRESNRDHPFTIEIVKYKNLFPIPSPSKSVTPSHSVTPTVTPSVSISNSATPSATPAASPSKTPSPTITPNRSVSPTQTPTKTVTPTISTTKTPSPTVTKTPSPSRTPNASNVFIELDFGDKEWFEKEAYELSEEGLENAWSNQNALFGTEAISKFGVKDPLDKLKSEYLRKTENDHVEGIFPNIIPYDTYSFKGKNIKSSDLLALQNGRLGTNLAPRKASYRLFDIFARKYISGILKYQGNNRLLFERVEEWIENYFYQYMKYSDFLEIENTIKDKGSEFYNSIFGKFEFKTNKDFWDNSSENLRTLINHTHLNTNGIPNYTQSVCGDLTVGLFPRDGNVIWFDYPINAGLNSSQFYWHFDGLRNNFLKSRSDSQYMRSSPRYPSGAPASSHDITVITKNGIARIMNSDFNRTGTNESSTLMLGHKSEDGIPSDNTNRNVWIRKIHYDLTARPYHNSDSGLRGVYQGGRHFIWVEWALHYTRNGTYINPPIMRKFYNIDDTFSYRNQDWNVVDYPPFQDFGMTPVRWTKSYFREFANAPLINPVASSIDSASNIEQEYELDELVNIAKSKSDYNSLDFGKYHEILKFNLEPKSNDLQSYMYDDYDPTKGHLLEDFTIERELAKGTYVKANFGKIGEYAERTFSQRSVGPSNKFYYIQPNDYYWLGSGIYELNRYKNEVLLPKVLQSKVFELYSEFGIVKASDNTGYFSTNTRNFPAQLFQVDTSRPMYVKAGSLWADENLGYNSWSSSNWDQKYRDYNKKLKNQGFRLTSQVAKKGWNNNTEHIIAYCNAFDNDGSRGLYNIEQSGWYIFVMHSKTATSGNKHYSYADFLDMAIVSFDRIGLGYNNSLSSLIKDSTEDLLHASEIKEVLTEPTRSWFLNYYGNENLIFESFSKSRKRQIALERYKLSNDPDTIDFSNIQIAENTASSEVSLRSEKRTTVDKNFKIDNLYKKTYFGSSIGKILTDEGKEKEGFKNITISFKLNNDHPSNIYDYVNGQYAWEGGDFHDDYPTYSRTFEVSKNMPATRIVKDDILDIYYDSFGRGSAQENNGDLLKWNDDYFKSLKSKISIKFYKSYIYGINVYENVWVVEDEDFGFNNTVYRANLKANTRIFVYKNNKGVISDAVDYTIPYKFGPLGYNDDDGMYQLSRPDTFYNGVPVYDFFYAEYHPRTSDLMGYKKHGKLFYEGGRWLLYYEKQPVLTQYNGSYNERYPIHASDGKIIQAGDIFQMTGPDYNFNKLDSENNNSAIFTLKNMIEDSGFSTITTRYENDKWLYPSLRNIFTVTENSAQQSLIKYHIPTQLDASANSLESTETPPVYPKSFIFAENDKPAGYYAGTGTYVQTGETYNDKPIYKLNGKNWFFAWHDAQVDSLGQGIGSVDRNNGYTSASALPSGNSGWVLAESTSDGKGMGFNYRGLRSVYFVWYSINDASNPVHGQYINTFYSPRPEYSRRYEFTDVQYDDGVIAPPPYAVPDDV